ncbi:DUF2845 domain-containing protein [Chryseobacterium lactis]|nr:DUF2845 domain-containing protein [Chryseobacterium lactis]
MILAFLTSFKTSSKFTSESVSIGMTKDQVISKFGKPYKSAFTENKETKEMEESLFYKENFNLGNSSITNILHFKGGKLVALEQGKESENNSTTIVTH